jgi:cyclic pyranopterin phosphate synthase
MDANKIPQLRIAVTYPCEKACVYCRPGGEAVSTRPSKEMTVDQINLLVTTITKHGVQDVKLTGGDPILRSDIVDIVHSLKSISGVRNVELVTRHANAGKLADQLKNAGLDCLNFSLDSLDANIWSEITRTKGHEMLMDAIWAAADSGISLKINTVVIKGVNDHEITAMIEFAGRLKCQIKFLDLIVDIPAFPNVSNRFGKVGKDYYFDLREIIPSLQAQSSSSDVYFQPGGLGHPMNRYVMPSGATVIIKSSRAGAWHGDVCKGCKFFPCHDALMALRLTSDGKLQYCLLREDNLVDLLGLVEGGASQAEINLAMQGVLDTYRNAVFYSHDELLAIRNEKVDHNHPDRT